MGGVKYILEVLDTDLGSAGRVPQLLFRCDKCTHGLPLVVGPLPAACFKNNCVGDMNMFIDKDDEWKLRPKQMQRHFPEAASHA